MIKAIIFDKDGTLINFDSFWVGITRNVIKELLEDQGLSGSELNPWLKAVGIEGEIIDPEGILAASTGHEAANAWYQLIKKPNKEYSAFSRLVIQRFDYHSMNQKHENHLFPGLKESLAQLKAQGLIIAVVTADTFNSTELTLQNTGLTELVDFIGADDGINPMKPHPFWGDEFCKQFDFRPEEVAMVGDTPTDMNFAKNCGFYAIGVSSGTSESSTLAPLADELLPTAADILKSRVFNRDDSR